MQIKKFFTQKKVVVVSSIVVFLLGSFFLLSFVKSNKKAIGIRSLSMLSGISKFLPIPDDEKKEIDAMNKLVEAFTKKDDTEKTFMIFLQNNMELRPGGGFLGQYAIVKIKNGEVISSSFEDANLLDRRIQAKITPPYPFTKLIEVKKWKFRDSNFSPDFPTNVEKAQYFYRLAGKNGNFDGFIAVNADVFNDILGITGSITVPGYGITFSKEDGALKLEEYVEKKYLMDPDLDTENRKAIMKQMTPLIIDKLASVGNISKIAELIHKEFKNRNIMVNFTDPNLQAAIEGVRWDGRVSTDWNSDYLMMVDANMGSLKTDYYMRREVSYDIDLTAERPVATLNILYRNTASYGDWRTMDYHTYLRVYVPKGSEILDRKMVSPPITGEDFGKTFFGSIVHVVMGTETHAMMKYQLPADFSRDDYKLLIQKQSGVGNIPVKVHVKTKYGEFDQEQILNNDLNFQFQ